MKKAAFALQSMIIAALTVLLFVEVASANPFMPSGSWSDEPAPPIITIESPTSATLCWIGDDVWLNFTVTVPITDWYSKTSSRYPAVYATTMGNLTHVEFSLDGAPATIATKVSESPLKVSCIYNPQSGISHFSANLRHLSAGQHNITITAEGSAYFGTLTHSAFSDSFSMDTQESDQTKQVTASSQCTFVVAEQAPISLSGQFPTVTIIAVSATIAAVAAAGLLVYSKKSKRVNKRAIFSS